MRATMLLLLSLTAWSSPVAGQVAPRGPAASVLFRDLPRGPLSVEWPVTPRDSVVRDIKPTYWKEGALVGGLLGFVGGFLLGSAVCESGNACITAAILGGGLLLLIPGALVGGQFEKGGDENAPPSD
ncbi:MAG TPA: hypothetical protein VNO19_15150 [Gemmatimonadales bacterium]|nr:hypothetical protein [Gemmatimonadales bacterium]